ncbi:MAG: HAD hydrolase-like protein [Gemmatimonadota bacterium]|jgi:phosphonatase-like hydrolase
MRRGFEARRIRLVVFDVVGTTVHDGGAETSVVADAYLAVFGEAGIAIRPEDVSRFRGLDKREAVARLLALRGGASGADTDLLTERLLARIGEALGRAPEIDGASDVFAFLHERGLSVALASGLPDALVQGVADRLGWPARGLVDYVTSAEAAGGGRPGPAMVLDAMRHFRIEDPAAVLKVGDTVADIEEGRNAGVWTVAVLTGTQGRDALAAAEPDFVLESVAALPSLLVPPSGPV